VTKPPSADISHDSLKPPVARYCRPMDVVRQTGLSKSTVMAALWSGRLEAYRMGRAWLIPIDAVDRWIRGEDETAA
jgi:excisionase family DNA binding protein